jgi:hypothetical protein
LKLWLITLPILLKTITLDLLMLTFKHHSLQYLCKWSNLFCRPSGVLEKSTRSSAYNRELIFFPDKHTCVSLSYSSKVFEKSFRNFLSDSYLLNKRVC